MKRNPEEVALWRRVIIQAIRDAGSANAKTRAEIYRWMNSVGFKDTCLMAGIQSQTLKKGISIIMETAENYPRIFVVKAIDTLEDELPKLYLKEG